jgi:putative ABC transport system permease protein
MRSKLFSGINIIGMAVSLSVGLLVIAFVSDLFSYDSSLQNKDRIYRVASYFTPAPGMQPMKLASASWKGGLLIRQQIPGVESVAILRRGFGGDAKINTNTIPVSGLYADESFFDVFSYPLIRGVAATALKQPNSLVITETTAKKLFGQADAMGKTLTIDTTIYTVTGIAADIPKLSSIQFEMLVSLSSIDLTKIKPDNDGDYLAWTNIFSNYIYVLLAKNTDPASFTAALDKLNRRENALVKDHKSYLWSQPVKNIAISHNMGNEIGRVFDPVALWTMIGLAFIIILSACFNYTNLSIARSLRRSREVGIRKVVGARRIQVIGQFIMESVVISLLSLCIAFFIFLLLRGQILSISSQLENAYSLELSPRLVICFIGLAIGVGIVAGLLPALFYAKIKAVQVLKDASSIKVFRHISLRKVLVVFQYTFSLIFITATVIGYQQYKGFLRFDLGFSTQNILNIRMQGNDDEVLVKELSTMPSIHGISNSLMIVSTGNLYGASMKYQNPLDSADVNMNFINENYLPLHKYTLIAGRNFTPKPKDAPESEIIVNEELLKRFNIAHRNPEKAIGEMVTIQRKRLSIVGVLKDFHYGTVESTIDPTGYRYSAHAGPGGWVNVKVDAANLPATMAAIEGLWKQIDKVHPLDAKLYDEQIEQTYSVYSMMLKVIGFFALLAICISSLGLFGMVIYTMEKRLKEISIRRVLGAGKGTLVYLLSRSFLILLGISAAIAIPLTWLFFDKVVLARIAYHQPIGPRDLFLGLLFVGGIAFIMIGAQTLKVLHANPASVLKNE